MHFRWRNNPTVIGQYMNDSDVPRQAEVTLKPNEICVILEDGKIVGSVSQTHMEVNPEVGLFGRIFGKSTPNRSFMFAFTGPHSIIVQVRGIANGGDEINCLLTLKVGITRESATRLINFPANGKMTVQARDIAELISGATQTSALEVLRGHSSQDMRTAKVSDDVIYAVKNGIKAMLDQHGMQFRDGFLTWSKTAVEQQIQHQHDLERIKINNNLDSEKKEIELNHIIETEQRKHEINARLALVGIQAQDSARMKMELDRLSMTGEYNLAKWQQENNLSEAKDDAARDKAIKDAQTNLEIAKLESERLKVLGSVQMEKDSKENKEVMDMFNQVQERKKERMRLKAEQEQARLEQHTTASQSTIATLEKIASSSTDPAVQMEALRQLAELRKADITGQKDAYTE